MAISLKNVLILDYKYYAMTNIGLTGLKVQNWPTLRSCMLFQDILVANGLGHCNTNLLVV